MKSRLRKAMKNNFIARQIAETILIQSKDEKYTEHDRLKMIIRLCEFCLHQ